MKVCSPWHDRISTRLLHDQLKGHTMAALMQWSAAANISEAVVALTILQASGVTPDVIESVMTSGETIWFYGNHQGRMTALRLMARNLVRRVDADTSIPVFWDHHASGLDGTASPDSQANEKAKVRRRSLPFHFVSFRFVPAIRAIVLCCSIMLVPSCARHQCTDYVSVSTVL
jgi:hypothetical protein